MSSVIHPTIFKERKYRSQVTVEDKQTKQRVLTETAKSTDRLQDSYVGLLLV